MNSRCFACPRACSVNRTQETGYCGEYDTIRLAHAGLHYGEEPPISLPNGSGVLFFSGCNMRCPHCQNWQISRNFLGKTLSGNEFLDLCLKLQEEGAENINLVTPSHFIPALTTLLPRLKEKGLAIPLVWNTSGYESVTALKSIHPLIDIYLPDLKTLDPELAACLYKARDYPQKVREFLLFAAETKPLRWEGDKLTQGVIVRHLILPGYLHQTHQVLEWFSSELKGKALISIMTQYTPVIIPDEPTPGVPQRVLSRKEYVKVLDWLEKLDLEEGYIQERKTGSEWLPDFTQRQPFLSQLSKTIWSCQD